MYIAVCEDNSIERADIVNTLKNCEPINDIEDFDSSFKLLERLKEKEFDILFLDIKMPDLDGIETAKAIRNINKDVPIVFITAYDNFCLDAFSVYAVDYILKPLKVERLENTVARIINKLKRTEDKTVSIKTQNAIYRINQDDIILVEKVSNRCTVFTKDFTFEVISPLKYFEDILDSKSFLRTHSGYLINLSKILTVKVNGNLSYTVFFKDIEKTALVSRSKKDKFFSHIQT